MSLKKIKIGWTWSWVIIFHNLPRNMAALRMFLLFSCFARMTWAKAGVFVNCGSDRSTMLITNASIGVEPIVPGGPLNISLSLRLLAGVPLGTPLRLSVTTNGGVSEAMFFSGAACDEHILSVHNVKFYVFGFQCPAAPGIHSWTLLAMVPPHTPVGVYRLQINIGEGILCAETLANVV